MNVGAGMTTHPKIRALTDAYPLVVFSSSWCPNCQQVLKALKIAKLNPHVIEVDSKWKQALLNTFGRYELQPALVPSVWVGDKYVGACNDGPERWMGTIPLLQKGKLQLLIKALEKERKSDRGKKRAKYRQDLAAAAEVSAPAASSTPFDDIKADELMEIANKKGAGKLQASGVGFLAAYAQSLDIPLQDFKALLKKKAKRGEQLHRMWWRHLAQEQIEELEKIGLCNRGSLQVHNSRLLEIFNHVEDAEPVKLMKIKIRRRKRKQPAENEGGGLDLLKADAASMWAGVLEEASSTTETSTKKQKMQAKQAGPPPLQRKMIDEPWLGWIVDGPKRYEGRLKRGFWARIKAGDQFVAFSKLREELLRVRSVKEYPDFAEAWGELGEALIPKCKSKEAAMAMYTKFNSVKDILKSGVVAVEVEVVPGGCPTTTK
jgi:ASC-1-like (ASCH) protein